MPFGLSNAPSTFQRTMDELLRNFKWSFCLVYIDDVIIYSKSEEEHLKHIDQFLEVIEKSGFKIKPKKTQLFRTKLNFLGHTISAKGVQPNQDKVEAIKAIPPPRRTKDIQIILKQK